MSDTTARQGSATRKIKWLAVAIVVLIVLYTIGWFYLASRVESAAAQAISEAEAQGTEIGCADRDVRGYPFRLGLHCDATVLATTDGVRFEAGAFRSAAQVYEPTRLISELDGPASFETPTASGTAEWRAARASTRIGEGGLQLGTVAIDDLRFAADPTSGVAVTGEVDRAVASIQPNGADLDAALTIDGLDLAPVEGRDLPPTTLNIDATLSDAASALRGGGPIESLRGRTVTLRNAGLALAGGGRIETSGQVAINADGLPTGEIEIGLSDPAATVAALSELFPNASGVFQAIGGVFGGASGSVGGLLSGVLGREEPATAQVTPNAEEGELKTITVALNNGQARVGLIPLGRVPPLP